MQNCDCQHKMFRVSSFVDTTDKPSNKGIHNSKQATLTLSALCGLGVATQSSLCPGRLRSHDEPFTWLESGRLSVSSMAPIAGSLRVLGRE